MDLLTISQIACRLRVARCTVERLIAKNNINSIAVQRQKINLFSGSFPAYISIKVYDFTEICRYLSLKKRVAA